MHLEYHLNGAMSGRGKGRGGRGKKGCNTRHKIAKQSTPQSEDDEEIATASQGGKESMAASSPERQPHSTDSNQVPHSDNVR